MGVVDMTVEVEHGFPARNSDLKLEGPPWANGVLTVDVASITSAIAWLAEQLRCESEARLKLEARLEAVDGACDESTRLAESAMSHNADKLQMPEQECVQQGLARRVEQLEKALASHKKQHALRAKACEDLCKLQVEALRNDVQSRAHKSDLADHAASLLLEAKGAARTEAREFVQAALSDEVSGLHSQLENLSGLLQSQLECFDEQLSRLAQQVAQCDQELAMVRASTAEGTTASMVSPSSSIVPADEDNGAPAPVSTGDGAAFQLSAPSSNAPVSARDGAAFQPCEAPSCDASDSASGMHSRSGFTKPATVEVPEGLNPNGEHGATGHGNVVDSRRPSAISAISTAVDTSGPAGDSNLNNQVGQEFVAWVQHQIDMLHTEIAELSALTRQTKVHHEAGGVNLASTMDKCHGSDRFDGLPAVAGHADQTGPYVESPGEDADSVRESEQVVELETGVQSTPRTSDYIKEQDVRPTLLPRSQVAPETGVKSTPGSSDYMKEQDVHKRLQELRHRLAEQQEEIQHHVDEQMHQLQQSLLSELDAQKSSWQQDLKQYFQSKLNAGNALSLDSALTVSGDACAEHLLKDDADQTAHMDVDVDVAVVQPNPSDLTRPATIASLRDELRSWLAEKHAKIQQSLPAASVEMLQEIADLRKRLQSLEGKHAKPAENVDPAATKARLQKLEARIVALENQGDHAIPESIGKFPAAQKSAFSSKANSNGVQQGSDNSMIELLDQLQFKIAKVARDQEEGRRETANVSVAVAGVQRAADLTSSRLEDLAGGLRTLQARVDVAMPQFLEALRVLASRQGHAFPDDVDSSLLHRAPGNDESGDGTSGSLKRGNISVESLQKLINNEMKDGQKLYVSPASLQQAIKALERDMHGCFDKMQNDIRGGLQGKANNHDLQSVIAKLRDIEQTWAPKFMFEDMPIEGEGVENAAGVRRPLQPSRCISCNSRVDMSSPWSRISIPSAPWPPRPRSVQNSPPIQARRRDSSLPAINRELGY